MFIGGTMKTSVILHGLHNEFSIEQMKSCIALAEKYGESFRHVVTGIQITGIEKEDKELLIAELPDGVVPVIHRGVNSLIACVGKGHCKNGQMDTSELADNIDPNLFQTGTVTFYYIQDIPLKNGGTVPIGTNVFSGGEKR